METSIFSIAQSEKRKHKPYLLAKSIDQHQELKDQLLATLSNTEINPNIFMDPMSLQLCKLDPNVGPKLDKNKIVRRSIVGKPDIFKKSKQPQLKLDTERTKRFSILKQTDSTFRQTNTNANLKSPDAISGEEVLGRIQLLEKQIFQNSLTEQQETDKMPFELRQQTQREQRAMDNYFNQEKIQNSILYDAAKHLKRDPSKSVMMDLYRYRRQKEYSVANDNLRMFSENRKTNIYEVDQDNNCVPLLMCQENQEVIRKPSVVSHDETTQSILRALSDDQAFNSFTTNQYIQDQYNKYKKYSLDKIQMSPDELIVFGQNKLSTESKVDMEAKYILSQLDKSVEEEEIFAQNYSAQYKLKYK